MICLMAAGVRILTAALDDCLNETKFIVPGLGACPFPCNSHATQCNPVQCLALPCKPV